MQRPLLRLAAPVLLVVALAGAAAAQSPYSPAITVNDAMITHYDIEQRMALLEALGAGGDLRALAVEQLTDDRLKLQAADAFGIEPPEAVAEIGLREFAEQRGLDPETVLAALEARGVNRQALDDFVEAGVLWREVAAAMFRERALPSDADVEAALALGGGPAQEVLELAEIALPFAGAGEEETTRFAEQLSRDLNRGGDFAAAARRYSRSDSAAQGGRLPPVPTERLPPPVRGQVLLLEPGQVTGPIPITGGVALLKLVSIDAAPAPADLTPEARREQVREQIFEQRITGLAEAHLRDLRRDALIVGE